MSPSRETPTGRIRVQISGVGWLDALKSSFIADNERWFEQRPWGHHGAQYVAFLDPQTALMVAHALEGEAKMIMGELTHARKTALERAVARIRADAAVEGYRDD